MHSYMYTKCPSCKSEIGFVPPADLASLPADQKYPIRCPSCGVTIGVHLNKVDRAATPDYSDTATSFIPVDEDAPVRPAAAEAAKSVAKPVKKYGTGRNIMMMIFSLVFIALSVVGYLIKNGTIANLPEWANWIAVSVYFDGISGWELLIKNFAEFKAMFSEEILYGILSLFPMILFTLSGINFLVAFISACGRKYGRAFNFIFSFLIAGVAVTTLFIPYIAQMGSENATDLIGYFSDMISGGAYLFIAGAAWGVLQLLFALIFCKKLGYKKNKK